MNNGWKKRRTDGTWMNGVHINGRKLDDATNKLYDFDVLCVVDHRMSWYAGDADGFASALSNVTKTYKHVLFVGASMGGFGAMLHGGRLADAVLAFGPQGLISDAALRP